MKGGFGFFFAIIASFTPIIMYVITRDFEVSVMYGIMWITVSINIKGWQKRKE